LNPNWRTGHYIIATLAIDQIGNANLKDLLNKNADLFSFDLTIVGDRGWFEREACRWHRTRNIAPTSKEAEAGPDGSSWTAPALAGRS
jgi:hypothetical protein